MDQSKPTVRLQAAAATLLGNLKSKFKASQVAVNNVVTEMDRVISIYHDVLQEQFRVKLSARNGYISLSDVNSVLDSFKGQSLFEGIQTSDRMDSYLREKSGGKKVILKQVVVESRVVISRGIPRTVPWKYGYYVPFLAQLEQLLNLDDVLHCVENPLPSEKGVYRTVTDGYFYKTHPLVLKHGPAQTLAIIIHVDDAEVCDPLKSKSGKHNLRLFYWVLGNIHPKKRSTLRAVNLLALARAKVAKEKGNGFLLEDFICAMIRLGTEGVVFCIKGVKRRFYAVLIFASCDMPAAANLGRFKETHCALRPCRQCMIKSLSMCEHFRESPSLMRNLRDHNEQVNQVMAHLGEPEEVVNIYEGTDVDEEEHCQDPMQVYSDHKNPSVNFGINGRSELSRIPHFDVTRCLPQDLMHLLNEGIVESVCRRILKELCCPPPRVKPILKIEDLNAFIQSMCDFGHLNADRPSVIDKGHLKGQKLKQSASQMLVLLRILPFIIHNRCSDDKLQLVLKLIKVVDECLSYVFISADIRKLEDSIEDFGNHFKRLYPDVKSLKLHCIVHLATQIRLFGPLRQQWCCAYESMHSKFTNIFPVVRSMKNVPVTAAIRHLSARNLEIAQRGADGNYLTDGDVVVPNNTSVSIENLPGCVLVIPDLNLQNVVEVKSFNHSGKDWQEGTIILVNKQVNLFGRLSTIYKIDEKLYLVFNYLNTEYMPEYNAFHIEQCLPDYHVVCFSELDYKFPMLRFSFSMNRRLKAFIMQVKPLDCF